MFRPLIPASVLLVAVVAACSGTAATPVPTAAPTAAPTASPAPSPAPTLGFTVSLAPAGFFVGPNAMTLYTFDNDALGTSNCTSGKCHDNWPPLALASGATLAIGAGLTESDFGTIAWPDGTTQVTFKDIPLYYFAGDTAIGETNGEGVGGVWHTATKQSTLPLASPSPSEAASATPTAASSSPSATPSAQASGCFDDDGYATACPSAAAGVTVSVSAEGNLVNAVGWTLYEFDNDTTEGASACTSADCAGNWPALTIEEGQTVTLGEGLDSEDFTTFTRSDNSATQVAYYTKPLYTFAGDSAAGDTNGDGLGGLWHIAKPQ